MLGIIQKPKMNTSFDRSCYYQKNDFKIKSEIIPIKKELEHNTIKKENSQHSLNENYFDPSKSSPPNEFLSKLQQRIDEYYKE